MNRTDGELVRSACAGDVDSFRALYERHYGLAVAIARSRLFDVHLAEDAAQEAFAIACRRLGSLRKPDRFAEWLGTICRRTAKRLARTQKAVAVLTHEPAARTETTDQSSAEIQQAMEALSSGARELVQLHYFAGLSHEEIGRVLGLSPQSVHGRLQRARRILFETLTKMRMMEKANERN